MVTFVLVFLKLLFERTTDRHVEQPPRAQILAGARARMLVESCAQTNRHTELQAMMLAEACSRIFAEACARMFPLRVWGFLLKLRVCKESRDHIFLLKVMACTEAHPQKCP